MSRPARSRSPFARLIADVYAGNLHPRIAAGLDPLMHLQLRVLQKTEIEKRLARLVRLLRESIGSIDRMRELVIL